MISTRMKSVQSTLADIGPLCDRIGITRIADITHMDKLYIPNYTAVLPGTEDSIWVYSGKGLTKSYAKASALMEAIERYSSLSSNYRKGFIQGSYAALLKSYNNVLHPDEVVEPTEKTFNIGNSIIDCVTGFDLQNNEEILVPVQLVLSRYSAKPPAVCVFPYSHTNGLASGNVLEEAICHALCEVIERDAASIADLCTSCIPYTMIERITNSLKNAQGGGYPITEIPEDKFVDDYTEFSDIDISEISKDFEPVKFLVKSFTDSGIPLLVKEITQKDIGIPTFVASSIEWINSSYGYFAKGYGTHPDARVALIRAITEVSQTRAGNIQGARDDLKKIKYQENDEIYKRKWQFTPTFPDADHKKRGNNRIVKFSEINTYINRNVLDDIKFILRRLRRAGLARAIIADLTNPDVGIPVVRAIVPGLETFEVAKLFLKDKLTMGDRAKKQFLVIHSPKKHNFVVEKIRAWTRR